MAILTRRKTAAAALVVVGIAGLSIASAAQLNLTEETSLGAGKTVVASCQPTDGPAIQVSFDNAYDAASKGYNATAVTLSGIATACETLDFKVTVSGADGVLIKDAAGTIDGTTETITLSAPAANVENVAVVIFDAPVAP